MLLPHKYAAQHVVDFSKDAGAGLDSIQASAQRQLAVAASKHLVADILEDGFGRGEIGSQQPDDDGQDATSAGATYEIEDLLAFLRRHTKKKTERKESQDKCDC